MKNIFSKPLIAFLFACMFSANTVDAQVTYCTPTGARDFITDVTVGEIYNTTPNPSDLTIDLSNQSGYTNYLAETGSMYYGREIFFHVYTDEVYTRGDTSNVDFIAYIDLNGDGDFTDPGEELIHTANRQKMPVTFSFVPHDSLPKGPYRVRMRMHQVNGAVGTFQDACSNATGHPWGDNNENLDVTIQLDDWNGTTPTAGAGVLCVNDGMEDGNFNGWQTYTGWKEWRRKPACGQCDDVWTNELLGGTIDEPNGGAWIGGNYIGNRHTIVTAGIDDNSPVQRVPPGGGTYSMRLGNGTPNYQADRAEMTFTVDPDAPNFLYRFAFIMDDPGHDREGQPSFTAEAFDSEGRVIPCTRLEFVSGEGSGWQTASGQIKYRDWETFFMNFTGYENTDVTVRFTVTDCAAGAHFGYVYLEPTCNPLKLEDLEIPVYCDPTLTELEISAPDLPGDFEYLWENGETTKTITVPVEDSVYTVQLIPAGGCAVEVKREVIVQDNSFEVSEPTIVCNADNTYSVSFLMTGTSGNTYTITPTSGTQVVQDPTIVRFESDPIPSGTPFSFDITDGGDCGVVTKDGTKECIPNCKTFPIVNAGNDTKICSGVTYVFENVTAIDAIEGYQLIDSTGVAWYTEEGTGELEDTATLTPTYMASADDAGKTLTFYLIGLSGSDTSLCPNAIDSVELTVAFPPTVEAGLGDTICQGDVFSITGSDSLNVSAIKWFHNGGGSLDSDSIIDPIYTPVKADAENGEVQFVLMGIGIAPCENIFDTVVATVQGSASAYAGKDAQICETGVYLVSSAVADGKSISWTHTGNGNFDQTDIIQPVYTPTADDAGTDVLLIIEVTAGDNCPIAIDTAVLSISSQPTVEAGLDTTICGDGSYIVQGSAIENALNYLWTHNGAGKIENNTSADPTYIPGIGDYGRSVILTVIAQAEFPCQNVQDSLLVNISEPAQVNAGDDEAICIGSTAEIKNTLAIGGQITWKHSGQGTLDTSDSNAPIYSPVVADVGNPVELIATIIPEAPCETVTDTSVITVIMPVEIDAGDPGLICQEGDYTVTNATVTPGIRYEWTYVGAGSLTDTNTLSPNYQPGITDAEKDIYLHLTAYPDSLCPELNDSVLIHIAGIVSVFAGDDGVICVGQDYSIPGVYASGYSSIEWNHDGGGTLDQSDSLNPVYTPGVSDLGNTIRIIVTARGVTPCNDTSDTVLLTVNLPPTVDAGTDGLICSTDSHELIDATSDNALIYKWTHTGTGSFDNDQLLNPIYQATPADAGEIITLYVEAMGQPSCQPAIDSMKIEISGQSIAYAGDPSSACVNIPYAIKNASAVNAIDFTWSHNGNGSLIDDGTLTPSYIPMLSDAGDLVEITLISHSKLPCTDDTSSVLLTILDEPTAFAGNDAVICFGESYEITDATAERNSSLNWIHNGDGKIVNNGSLIPRYIPGIKDAGKVVVITFTVDPLAPCMIPAVDKMEITIDKPATVSAGSDAAICSGETFSLSGTALNHSSVLWEVKKGSGLLENSTSLTPNYVPVPEDEGKAVVLLITAQGNGTCPSISDEVRIRIVAQPKVDAGEPADICITELFTLNATIQNAAEIIWSHDGDGKLENEQSVAPTYRPSWSDRNKVVSFTLTAKAASPCQQDAVDQTYIRILPTPGVYAGGDFSICAGETAYLDNANAADYVDVTWEVVTGKTANVIDPNVVQAAYKSDLDEGGTEITLVATATPIAPCLEPKRDTIVVTINRQPDFQPKDGGVCPGESHTVEIDVLNVEADVVYDWYLDSSMTQFLGTSATYELNNLTKTTELWMKPARGCMIPPEKATITVFDLPVAKIYSDTLKITEPFQTITFEDSSLNATTGIWDFGDGNVAPYLPSTVQQHHYVIEAGKVPNSFVVDLSIETINGCKDDTKVIIPVDLKWAIYIPNAFTPNNDGVNETFRIAGYGIDVYKLYIFNRWGDNIYTSDDLSKQWDGRDHIIENKSVVRTDETKKMDTYVYKVEVMNIFGEKHTYRGEVNLIR